ncbi:MAG: 5-oxoprolinase, partial [Pseudomonadota bacterium]|nr:5-oxoprolinase [Pseudomonadota bacterium]
MTQRRWQFSIDRGGTFTDIVGRSPDGTLETLKLLSDSEHYRDAALEGMRRMLKMGVGEPIRADRVEAVRMGTTIATNALLERRGARTLLVITRGFRDALRIGNQARPRIFDRRIAISPAVYEQVIEASERVSADGTIIEPLDEAALAVALRRAFAEGLRACAIVFLHGYRQAAHE